MTNTTPIGQNDQKPDDVQVLGHLVASAVGTVLVLLVDLGVPLSDAVQRDVLSLVIVLWALGSGIYAFAKRARSPVVTTTQPGTRTPARQIIDRQRQSRSPRHRPPNQDDAAADPDQQDDPNRPDHPWTTPM